jgi:hypothetical protein
VGPGKWLKDFDPMGAATNVTTVYFGTAWTSPTMLAQEMGRLEEAEQRDGIRRVFRVPADAVGAEVPAYAAYVRKRVEKLGRNHPLIRTHYYLEAIDAEAGMFPPQRQALMRGDHERRHDPVPGHRYALLIDVAGEDETAGDATDRAALSNPRRDATAMTVVEVDYGCGCAYTEGSHAYTQGRCAYTQGGGAYTQGRYAYTEGRYADSQYGRLPTYRTVDRRLWLGVKHTALHAQILALARHWHAVWVVVDATGVGAGLASFLGSILGDHRDKPAGLGYGLGHGPGHGPVIPVLFSSKVKSDLGWNFLAIVETGRYRDYAYDCAQDTAQFWYEVDACQREVRSGPERLLRWGVREAPAYDGRIARGHDDLLMSAALCAILDGQDWPGSAEGATVEVGDALEEIDEAAW